MVTSGTLAPVGGQIHDANAQQGTEAGLQLTATGSSVVVPGHNVTANFTLTNVGDQPSTAPAVELVNVPGGWEVVDQSAGPNLTWSETNEAWVSTETLAPGESLNVSATFRLPNETAQSVYHVSARGFDANGDDATVVEEFSVGSFGDEPLTLTASAPDSVRPGENATVTLSLRNDGSNDTVAPAVDLASVPSDWTVVNHSEPANATWSETNEAWVSTETLAPGESLNVTVTMGTDPEAAVGPYFVSVSGYGEGGERTASAVRVDLSGEPVAETTEAADVTTTAEAETTTEAIGATTEGIETTAAAETTEGAGATTAEASATFAAEDGENVTVSLEVADDPQERRQGLMFRESLPENHGMVFVYDDAEPRSFWMKNTLIPLDMIFVAPNGTVLNVEHAAPQPNASDEELRRYRSDGDAMYVVELSRGFANRTGVDSGTQVTFDGLNASATETTAAD